MKKLTHIIFGFGLTYYIISLVTTPTLLYMVIAIAFTLIPDLDLRYKHRKALHNIFAALILSFAASASLGLLGSNSLQNTCSHYVFLTAITAYLSHIFLDSLTLRGVDVLWPISRRTVGLRTVLSNSRGWNLAISLIGAFFLIISII